MEKVAEKGRFALWYTGQNTDLWVIVNSDTNELKTLNAHAHWAWLYSIGEFYWDEGLPHPEDRRESTAQYERWVFGTIVHAQGGNAMVTWEVQRFHEHVVEYVVTEPLGPVHRRPTGKMEWRTAVRVLEVE